MSWMQTGPAHVEPFGIDLSDPQEEDINWTQLARALARIPRYSGHGRVAISVAEHSVRGADFLQTMGEPARVCLAFLLHDAAEAYCGDMTYPMQCAIHAVDPDALAVFKAVQRRVSAVICRKAGIEVADIEARAVKHVDLSLCQDERPLLFMRRKPVWRLDMEGYEPLGVKHAGWPATTAAMEFERRLHAWMTIVRTTPGQDG